MKRKEMFVLQIGLCAIKKIYYILVSTEGKVKHSEEMAAATFPVITKCVCAPGAGLSENTVPIDDTPTTENTAWTLIKGDGN